MQKPSPTSVSYFRNFVFGVEDSLVSTVGLLAGIAAAGAAAHTILLTGIVLIFVEGFSMGAGSYLSESTAEDYEEGKEAEGREPFFAASIMFISYFFSGFVPLAPYILLPVETAFWVSIGVSIAALGVLGAVGSRFTRVGLWRSVKRMVIIGGMAILIGVVAGVAIGV
jgi:VIT1/CCC1 family predicted Fe2+/Mn2+ transporter